mgnify:FL=1
MARDKSFHDYVVYDVLGDMQGITSKAMFSGWGIYKDGVIFAIIIEGELYFKAGKDATDFKNISGSHPFVYSKKDGKKITMSYWLIPEEILENKEKLYELIRKRA